MSSNPRNIKWPTDKAGFLYRLKHAGVQAVEKQYGHAEKHATLVATLEVLLEHAKERYEAQRKGRQALIKSLEPKAKVPELIGPVKPAKPEYK